MGVGRFFCVALPFILSAVSLIALLIACLGGVSNKDLYMFRIDMREMSISRADLQEMLEDKVGGKIDDLVGDAQEKVDELVDNAGNQVDNVGDNASDIGDNISEQIDNAVNNLSDRDLHIYVRSDNITAEQLGLDNIYDVALWGYCTTNGDGDRTCTDPAFDWAQEHLNTSFVEIVRESSQGRIDLPDEVSDAIELFKNVSKWTQVVYIISFVALALSVICGIFANCTRIMSCVTFLVATIAEIAVIAAASLSTVMSAVVVGTAEGSAKLYGVRGGINTTFLALVWISAAAAIGAAFFWLFTICCCAPNHTSRRDRKARNRESTDGEKLLGAGGNNTAYQPLGSPNHQGFYNSQTNSQYGAPRFPTGDRDMAYEPYSHRG